MSTDISVATKDKYCLTIEEASEYFHIGQKKIRQLASEHIDSGIFNQNGVKVLVKRKRFEAFLDDVTSI